MKNPLQSLLIAFAIGLCALCTWQWHGQMLQQKRLDALSQSNYDQSVAIQGYAELRQENGRPDRPDGRPPH